MDTKHSNFKHSPFLWTQNTATLNTVHFYEHKNTATLNTVHFYGQKTQSYKGTELH